MMMNGSSRRRIGTGAGEDETRKVRKRIFIIATAMVIIIITINHHEIHEPKTLVCLFSSLVVSTGEDILPILLILLILIILLFQ